MVYPADRAVAVPVRTEGYRDRPAVPGRVPRILPVGGTEAGTGVRSSLVVDGQQRRQVTPGGVTRPIPSFRSSPWRMTVALRQKALRQYESGLIRHNLRIVSV